MPDHDPIPTDPRKGKLAATAPKPVKKPKVKKPKKEK